MSRGVGFRLSLAAVCGAGLVIAASLSRAEGAAASGDAADTQPASPALEEIVITAQKRQESLESVAIAGTVFTSDYRDAVGMESIQDLTNYTPGITYSHQLDRMYVRGVGRQTNNLALDPAVATYLDGFYSSFNRVGDSSSLFISQEEIYRGPQGTLFGRNAIGGAFNVSSPRPSEQWEGEARARLGNFEYKDIEGTVSGPLTDWLRTRIIAGEYKQDQGYFQSINGHQNDGYGLINDQEYQIQFAGTIGSKVDWWFKTDHHHWNNGYGTGVQVTPYITNCPAAPLYKLSPSSPLLCGGLGPSPWASGPGISPSLPPLNVGAGTNSLKLPNDTENRERLKDDEAFVFQAAGHLGWADLKYEGGYYSYEYDLVTDYDNTSRPSYTYSGPLGTYLVNSAEYERYEENKHYYSNELDLVSTTEGPVQWVVGLYQFHEKLRQPVGIGNIVPQPEEQVPLYGFTPTFQPIVAPANPSGEFYQVDEHVITQSEAAFGQIDWKIADAWKTTFGLRYNRDRREAEDLARYVYWDPSQFGPIALDISPLFVAGGATPDPSGSGFYQRHLENNSHAVTGTAGVEWTPTADQLGYLKYSRGYKDAGINAGNAIAASPYTKPEFLDAYEVGWKQVVRRQFQINADFFYYKYKQAQFPLTLNSGFIPTTAFYNIDEKVYGAEFETLWQATDNLRLLVDYAYTKATFTDHSQYFDAYTNALTGVYGNQVPGSPKNKFTFNGIYTWNFTPGNFELSGTYAWRDRVTSSPFGDPEFVAGSYGVTDFRGTWNDRTNRWSVFGYVKNAFDVRGADQVALTGVIYSPAPQYTGANGSTGTTTITRSIIPPRTFGVEFRVRFGEKVHE